MSSDGLKVRVKRITWEALGIISLELRSAAGGTLPAFCAGAHVDLALPNGLLRQYSLLTAPSGQTDAYVVAVNLDTSSQGGSRYIHNDLKVGQILDIGVPRNHFPLDETTSHSVFIGGGIGITPLYCMMQRLGAMRRSFDVVYATRSRYRAAYLNEIVALCPDAVVHHDDEHGGSPIDLAPIIAGFPPDTHFYCCGPPAMMSAFEKHTASLPERFVHCEYFSPKKAAQENDREEFKVTLARSGVTLKVPSGKSILDVLIENGLSVHHSCCQGVCGSCEVAVLSGIPNHRDSILLPSQRARNDVMMVCVSGSLSEELILDI